MIVLYMMNIFQQSPSCQIHLANQVIIIHEQTNENISNLISQQHNMQQDFFSMTFIHMHL